MRVVSVDEMRALEAETFATGVSEAELQLRAGRAAAEAVVSLQPPPGAVVSLVGPGNNGRDAWIAAQRLLGLGWSARLYLAPGHTVSDAELKGFIEAGGRVERYQESEAGAGVQAALVEATVAIDGLLGIGGRGAPRGALAEIVDAANHCREASAKLLVVAVDVPSGVDADTGIAAGPAVVADATVVLGAAKRGLLTPAAARYTGALVFADIGVVDGPAGAPEVITAASVRGLLPRPTPDSYKGTFGRVLVVAGSDRYVGAAYLACAAALRSAAGLVTLAAPRWLRDVIASRLPEAIYLPLPDAGPVGDPDDCADRVSAALAGFDALAIGPGLSTEGGVPAFVEAVLRRRAAVGLPCVVDADGLNALAQRPDWPHWIGDRAVMTPHSGELRRLAPDAGDGDEAAWDLARRLASRWGVALVLKGAFTGIGSGGRAWVHARPNPGLATGGTGDVLTGLVGALLARGLSPEPAARLGVWAHGEAGWRATRGRAAGGSLASDLLAEIPAALAQAVVK